VRRRIVSRLQYRTLTHDGTTREEMKDAELQSDLCDTNRHRGVRTKTRRVAWVTDGLLHRPRAHWIGWSPNRRIVSIGLDGVIY
jgi:hypothetical protein